MEVTELVSVLSGVVSNNLFPILACFFMYKQQLNLNESINKLAITLQAIDTRLEQIEKSNQ